MQSRRERQRILLAPGYFVPSPVPGEGQGEGCSVKISLIVAAAENNLIGKDNALPWRLPADLKYFKTITLGKPVVMGRKTWDSIGKPLPGRLNIVVTRQRELQLPGAIVVSNLNDAMRAAGGAEELMIIGGAEIFREMLPRADRIYLTRVHARIEGEVFFPELDAGKWQELSREDYAADERHAFAYSFLVLERI
jgi:dihydrofolate reductase